MLIKISIKKHIIINSTPGFCAYTLIKQIQQSWNKIILKHALIMPLYCPHNFSVSPLPRGLMANYSAWKIHPSVLTPSNFHSLISSDFCIQTQCDITAINNQAELTEKPPNTTYLYDFGSFWSSFFELLWSSSPIWLIVPSHCSAGRTVAKSKLHVVPGIRSSQ